MKSYETAVPEAPNLLINALWMLLHTVITWVESVSHLLRYGHKVLSHLQSPGRLETYRLKQSQQFIRAQLQRASKVPKHLVVLLGPEQPDYERLSRFIFWSYAAGIDYVSFYDHNGIVKRNHELIRQCVLDTPLDEKDAIVWVHQPATAHRDAPERRQTMVTCLSPEDGKQGLVNLSRAIGESVRRRDLAPSEVSIDFLNDRLQASRNYVPDPDLAVYFGNICSTYGLLPWQIRLTEFLPLEWRLRDSTELHFVNCLLKYAKCEQRQGT